MLTETSAEARAHACQPIRKLTFIIVIDILTIINVNSIIIIKRFVMNSICYKCKSKINRNDHWYGLHENCFIEWFKLSSLDRLQNLAARYQTEQPSIAGTKNSTFFHGMFRKYSCTLNDISYILKVEEPEFRELPATEYLCNQIYKMLGLNIPPFFLINLEEDVSCFVTENFMSNFQESNLVHMYHLLASHERYDCETLVQIIADKTGLLCSRRFHLSNVSR